MDTQQEITDEQKKLVTIKLLRDAANMIENADYADIDTATYSATRGLREIILIPETVSFEPDYTFSFDIHVCGNIGNN